MPLSRLRRRLLPAPEIVLEKQPDALPKAGLFTEPIRVTRIEVLDPAEVDDGTRVTFLVEVKDAEDRRCSDVSVAARVTSPVIDRVVQGTTDMLGRIRFRTVGPSGRYRLELDDVGAGGLRWDTEAGPTTAEYDLA